MQKRTIIITGKHLIAAAVLLMVLAGLWIVFPYIQKRASVPEYQPPPVPTITKTPELSKSKKNTKPVGITKEGR